MGKLEISNTIKERFVKKALLAIAGLILLVQSGNSASVECSNAYTRMEMTICADPQLIEVESLLSSSVNEAINAGVISYPQSVRLRNRLAIDCRRTDPMNRCLLLNAREKVQWLTYLMRSAEAKKNGEAVTKPVGGNDPSLQKNPATGLSVEADGDSRQESAELGQRKLLSKPDSQHARLF